MFTTPSKPERESMTEIVKQFLNTLKDWLELLAPFGLVGGAFWRWWLKDRLAEARDLYKKVQVIAGEFRPNGGSTLRDAINRIEQKLSMQEQTVTAIIKSFPVGTWTSDKYGKCVDVNKTLCKIMNRTESEIKGDNWSNWIHPDEKDDVFEEWKRCVENMINFDMTYRYILPDGTEQKVHGMAYQLRDEKNELMGFLGTLYAIGDPE